MYFPTLFVDIAATAADVARDANDQELDSDGDDVDALADRAIGATLVAADGGDDSGGDMVGGKRKRLATQRAMSKRYRDSLGSLYADLKALVPAVYPDAVPRTKSQIIQQAGDALRKLRSEVAGLEARHVLSSPPNRTLWIERVVRGASSFPAAVEPFMRLMVLHGWTYAEMWSRTPYVGSCDRDKPPAYNLTSVVSVHDSDPLLPMPPALASFMSSSKQMTFHEGDSSLVGRISATLSSEWIVLSDESPPYARAESARQAGFKVCCALPLLLRGYVAAAVMFYNNEYNSDVRTHLGIAQDIGAHLGNCFGALRKPTDDSPDPKPV
jgi:Helix-loop-helix DNA-binding domain